MSQPDSSTATEGKPTEELPGMLAVAKAVHEQRWPHTMDAKVWAEEFIKALKGHPVGGICVDEGTMIGWFANAIMAGYDTARARSTPSAEGDSTAKALEEWARHAAESDAELLTLRGLYATAVLRLQELGDKSVSLVPSATDTDTVPRSRYDAACQQYTALRKSFDAKLLAIIEECAMVCDQGAAEQVRNIKLEPHNLMMEGIRTGHVRDAIAIRGLKAGGSLICEALESARRDIEKMTGLLAEAVRNHAAQMVRDAEAAVRPEAAATEQLRKLVEAVEKWDDAEEPDDLDMIEAATKARQFLDGASMNNEGSSS